MKSELQRFLELYEYEPRKYSGRGMFGKNCLGVSFSHSEFSEFLARLVEYASDSDCEDPCELANNIRTLRSDSLGHDMVYYFPGVEFVESETSNEEEEIDDEA